MANEHHNSSRRKYYHKENCHIKKQNKRTCFEEEFLPVLLPVLQTGSHELYFFLYKK